MIRAFLAVELPEEIRQEVAQLQQELKKVGGEVKWVAAQNLHLTLKFLGDIDEEKVPSLSDALQESLQEIRPFPARLEGVGAFPDFKRPRVLWVGVTQGKELLIQIAEKLETACESFGIAREERPFSAHLTMGRVRDPHGLKPLIEKLEKATFQSSTPAQITSITLFQSVLSPTGPSYTPLSHLPLS